MMIFLMLCEDGARRYLPAEEPADLEVCEPFFGARRPEESARRNDLVSPALGVTEVEVVEDFLQTPSLLDPEAGQLEHLGR
jgi:hypothetical protein